MLSVSSCRLAVFYINALTKEYVLVVYLKAVHFLFSTGFSKKLEAISKQRDCEKMKKWIRGINNHVYFTALGTTSGEERLAKWTAMLNHVQDIHTHEDPLYPACEHAARQTRDPTKYLHPGVYLIYLTTGQNSKRIIVMYQSMV